jgi:phosphate transport system substrate-binding protein
VDFGATDGPMNEEQMGHAKVPILHFPTVLGAVVATYNLPGVDTLRLTPETLAGIFLGKITMWNDPRSRRTTRAAKLPAQPIVPVHRSDGSGTTYVFVDYLSKVSPEWSKSVGRSTSVAWPSASAARATRASPAW